MKTILQTVLVAALVMSTQAKAEDSPIVLPSQWTYADRAAPGGSVDAFPGSAPEMIGLESRPTQAAGVAQATMTNAFPGELQDPIVLESKSTYADKFANERSKQARAASDAALSE